MNFPHILRMECNFSHALWSLERRFLTIEDAEDSAAGYLQRMCFVELSAECRWHWERESDGVNVQKKPRGQEEKQRKCKRKKHVVDSLHKPGIIYVLFHVRFNHILLLEVGLNKLVTPAPHMAHPHMRIAHIHTHTARHEASCTCVPLVLSITKTALCLFSHIPSINLIAIWMRQLILIKAHRGC